MFVYKRSIVLVLSLVFILNFITFTFAEDENILGDIELHWGKNFIERLSNANIVSGYPDKTFRPQNTMTRAEFVTVLVKSLKYDLTDVEGMWYQKYLDSALENGIINSNTMQVFNEPQVSITRIEAVNLLSNLVEKEVGLINMNVNIPSFTDTDINDLRNIAIVYSYGIMSGYPDHSFKPANTLTRAEVSAIYSNMFFGKRNNFNEIIELPIFYIYEDYFSQPTLSRIQTLKNGENVNETDKSLDELVEEAKEKYEATDLDVMPEEHDFIVAENIDMLIDTHNNLDSTKILVDLRSKNDFESIRIKGSVNKIYEELLADYDENTFVFVYDHDDLTEENKNELIEKYKYVMFLKIEITESYKVTDFTNYEGTRTNLVEDVPSDSNVPEYLIERFDEIGNLYNLTWTDEDFENWYNTSSDAEIEKYFSLSKSVPIFDFENRNVLISERGYSKGDLKNYDLNNYNHIFGVNNMGYIAYEVFKKNVEYMMNDGADWGKIHIYSSNDIENMGAFIQIKDDLSLDINESLFFKVLTNASDADFVYWLRDQDDKETTEIRGGWYVYEDSFDEYINNNTKMNMMLLHGADLGQQVFENYMLAYEYRVYNGLDSDPLEEFDTVINGYTIHHIRPSDYSIYYTKN